MRSIVGDWALFAVCAGYGLAVIALQSFRVTWPRDWLVQRSRDLELRIETQRWSAGAEAVEVLQELRKRVKRHWLLVGSSTLQAGWRQVHSIEDEHVADLDDATVHEELLTARARLVRGGKNATLVARIDEALASSPPDPARSRALLRHAKVALHDANDAAYEELAALFARASLLTALTLALIVALGVVFENESLFLLGAAGALLGRLARVLVRPPKASDWGLGWSALMLALPAGALAGWLGVLLADVLGSQPFGILSSHFSGLWETPTSNLALVVALVFGFSEPLFNRVLGLAAQRVGAERAAAPEAST